MTTPESPSRVFLDPPGNGVEKVKTGTDTRQADTSPMDQQFIKAALETISGDRRASYGEPEANLAQIMKFWNPYIDGRKSRTQGFDLDATDHAALMILLKVARLVNSPSHGDTWKDIIGYAAIGARVSGAAIP